MNNIYQETLQLVSAGARFKVDLFNLNLMVDGKYIITNGQFSGQLGLPGGSFSIGVFERLYDRYNHSIPSERTEHKPRTLFRALVEHELTDEDMLYGESREVAQVALELYVLCSVLNGSLTWDVFQEQNPKALWFWQSPNHPTLIVFKNWFKN